VARLHAEQSGLAIDYRVATAEELAAAGETFDAVLAMEVIEHVVDRDGFVSACAELLAPGGLLFAATINRTRKAYALAIVAAERLLRWLPPGTHDYNRLVRPDELDSSLRAAGLEPLHWAGVTYNPVADSWRQSGDLDVNYMLVARKPARAPRAALERWPIPACRPMVRAAPVPITAHDHRCRDGAEFPLGGVRKRPLHALLAVAAGGRLRRANPDGGGRLAGL
jgi:SAM-dependent methyltransferase